MGQVQDLRCVVDTAVLFGLVDTDHAAGTAIRTPDGVDTPAMMTEFHRN
jgi:hypothetical protein